MPSQKSMRPKKTPITARANAAGVARILAHVRQRRGLKQAQLARRLGVKNNMVSQVESTGINGRYGVAWSMPMIVEVAKALRVPDYISYLLHLQACDGGPEVAHHLGRLVVPPYERWALDRLMIVAHALLDPNVQLSDDDRRWAERKRLVARWRLHYEADKVRRFQAMVEDLRFKGLTKAEIIVLRSDILARVETEMRCEENMAYME